MSLIIPVYAKVEYGGRDKTARKFSVPTAMTPAIASPQAIRQASARQRPSNNRPKP
jgi:hypothetical protein